MKRFSRRSDLPSQRAGYQLDVDLFEELHRPLPVTRIAVSKATECAGLRLVSRRLGWCLLCFRTLCGRGWHPSQRSRSENDDRKVEALNQIEVCVSECLKVSGSQACKRAFGGRVVATFQIRLRYLPGAGHRVYSIAQLNIGRQSGETSDWAAICTYPGLHRRRIEKERLASPTENISRSTESQKGSPSRRVAQ